MIEIIAELSCNHLGDFDRLRRLIDAAVASGADAVKLQLDNPDGGITIQCDAEPFRIKLGPWAGRTLGDLYRETYTPWDWVPWARDYCREKYPGVSVFATPTCVPGVEFLEAHGFDRYKVASFEITDVPLFKAIAKTRKPVMVSLGCAAAVDIAMVYSYIGECPVTLMHCVSAYPTPDVQAHLGRLGYCYKWAEKVGLSDHSLGDTVACVAAALGVVAIEKHLTLSRADGGPDAGFSMEPVEFAEMVRKVRQVEAAMRQLEWNPPREFVKSLFIVQDVAKGEPLTANNVRSIRPAGGLHPVELPVVLGRTAARDLKRGEPVDWGMLV